MRADVHLEGTQAGALLVTELAGEAELAGQLPVPGQPGRRVMGLVAMEAPGAPWGAGSPLGPEQSVWSLVRIWGWNRGPPRGQNQQWGQAEVFQSVCEGHAGG